MTTSVNIRVLCILLLMHLSGCTRNVLLGGHYPSPTDGADLSGKWLCLRPSFPGSDCSGVMILTNSEKTICGTCEFFSDVRDKDGPMGNLFPITGSVIQMASNRAELISMIFPPIAVIEGVPCTNTYRVRRSETGEALWLRNVEAPSDFYVTPRFFEEFFKRKVSFDKKNRVRLTDK
ncbi:MAG: hypothetical protein NTY53_04665 [Kiritimatiellaeota bacterium]|nr:hypothetical protein [Kiritimatiellota bacterium]